MCNCNKNRSAASARRAPQPTSGGKFVLVTREGENMQYGSQLEADAANARNGYTGIVKPAGA